MATTVPQTREQILADMMKTAQGISASIKTSAPSFTAQERNSLSTSLSQASNALPKATAPTTATNINKTEPIKMPQITPTIGDPAKAFASNTAVTKLLDEQAKMLAEQNARDIKTNTESQSWLKDFFNQPTASEQRTTLEKNAGLTEADKKIRTLITESETLMKDYNATKAQMDNQIQAIEQNPMGALASGVDERVRETTKHYSTVLNQKSADLNAKAAVTQMLQGNVNSARDYINQAVQDYTAEKKDKLNAFLTVQQMNADLFDKIDKRYSEAYSNAINFANQEYQTAVEEKKLIGEYMLKYPNAGISISDSLEETSRKIGAVTGSVDTLTADQKNYEYAVRDGYTGSFTDFLGKGGGTNGTNFIDIMQQTIDAGGTPEQAAREAAIASELTGIPVDQKTLAEWTTEARKLIKTPAKSTFLQGSNTVSSYGNVLGDTYANLFGL